MSRKLKQIDMWEAAEMCNAVSASISECTSLSESDRVAIYNEAMKALSTMMTGITTDPACFPRLIKTEDVQANDYNPNHVASTEMDLLENSIRADGVTMPIVVIRDGSKWTVVDGFHRKRVTSERLGRKHVPCSIIDKPIVDRMASTVRHNRARGKHHVDLMAELVKGMLSLGWDDEKIAENLGMSVEELLRLKQMVGAARMMADPVYSREWGVIDPAPDEREEEG